MSTYLPRCRRQLYIRYTSMNDVVGSSYSVIRAPSIVRQAIGAITQGLLQEYHDKVDGLGWYPQHGKEQAR